MSFLKYIEEHVALKSLELFRDFDTTNFNTNAKIILTEESVEVPYTSVVDYANIVLKAINGLCTITLDKENIKRFISEYSNFSKITQKPLIVEDIIPTNTIEAFKFQYIDNYLNMIDNAFTKMLSAGDITSVDLSAISQLSTNDIPFKVEKQIVKTNFGYGSTPKDLIKHNHGKLIKVDESFIKNRLLPFVSNYDSIRDDVIKEARVAIDVIKEADKRVDQMHAFVENYKEKEGIGLETVATLNSLRYSIERNIIEIISFVSFMVVRKCNIVATNTYNANRIYVDIMNACSTTESVFDNSIIPLDFESVSDSMVKGDNGVFKYLSEELFKFHTSIPGLGQIADEFNKYKDEDEYTETTPMYKNISKIFIEISTGCDIIAGNSDEYLLIFDDLISQAGFILRLEDRFRNTIATILDISEYQGYTDVNYEDRMNIEGISRILMELKRIPSETDHIVKNIMDTHTKITALEERFEKNINGEFKDAQATNELKMFMRDLLDQFNIIVNQIAKNLLIRLKSIDNILTTLTTKEGESSSVPVETSSNLEISENVDFCNGIFESIMESYEEETNNIFKHLEMNYYAEKQMTLRGEKVVFEADNQNTNGTTSTTTTTTNTQNNNSNNTSVSVQDNSSEGNSGNSVAAKVGEWIRNTINKFMEYIGNQGKKNATWLSSNKDSLLNRSYNNVSINILPYSNIEPNKILDDIKKLNSNVQGLTPQALNSMNDKNAVYKKLFSFMQNSGSLFNGEPDLKTIFTKYYKVGNAELNVVTIANGELKNEITNRIIPYCENYYGSYSENIKTALNDISTKLDSMQEQYSSANVGEKSKWINDAVKMFSGSVLNAIKDRCSDYFKVLSSLAPKAPATPAGNTGNNNQNNTENTTS